MNKKKQNKKAVVLLSGGIDSTTTLAIAKNEKFQTYCLSFNYGQRHLVELNAAKRVAFFFGIKEHLIMDINMSAIGGSALTDSIITVPKNRTLKDMDKNIPITYVPSRNLIFLSFALSWAEVIGASDIFIGVNAIDYSGYPDCRPEFIKAFQEMANLATKAGVSGTRIKINTPLINLTKSEIIKKGLKLGVDYKITFSCYDPDPLGKPCNKCDSCILRKKGFDDSGYVNP